MRDLFVAVLLSGLYCCRWGADSAADKCGLSYLTDFLSDYCLFT